MSLSKIKIEKIIITVHRSKTMPVCRILTVVPRKKKLDVRNRENAREKLTFCNHREGDKLANRKKGMKEHSRTEEYRERDLSGHGKKATERRALTL